MDDGHHDRSNVFPFSCLLSWLCLMIAEVSRNTTEKCAWRRIGKDQDIVRDNRIELKVLIAD
eukprot:scaffold1165_cov126-Skeletonema_dohrnii-CCMP3373.AAC.7